MQQNAFSRREIISRAALLAGAAGVAPLLAACGAKEVPYAPVFFDPGRFAILRRISDIIIPRTDTPGADDVGVAQVIDAMIDGWASEKTRLAWNALFDEFTGRAQRRSKTAFVRWKAEEQVESVSLFDDESLALGANRYQQLKDFVIAAYFSSEAGATQALRYDPQPGAYRGCVPFSEIGRAWYN